MLMHHLLLDNAERRPEQPAFTWVDRGLTLSHAQAASGMSHMAGALRSLGVASGDRVSIVAHNGMDYLLAMLGCWRIGAIAALVNVRFAAELAEYFADHSPRVVIYTHDLHQEVRQAAAQVASITHLLCMDGPQDGALSLPELVQAQLPAGDDPAREDAVAHLSYTSGTTGRPKGACLAHEPTVRACRCIAERLRLRAQDVSFGPTALSSSYQLVANVLAPMSVGAHVQVMRFWSASAGWAALNAAQATVLVANPTLLQELLSESLTLSSPPQGLRLGLSGGGPVPVALKKAWRDQLGLPLVESFGQSELGGFMALGYPELEFDNDKLLRVGPPLPDKQVWIADEQGVPLASGQIGQIVLRGGCMAGYWNQPDASARAIRGARQDELHTGDLGLIDADGYLTMRGRRSEVFAIDGHDWFPRDIEEALCQMDIVRQAAVIGVPDASHGCRALAFITLQERVRHPDLAHLKQALQTHLPYSIAALSIRVVDSFPMTPTGKIAKGELAQRARC